MAFNLTLFYALNRAYRPTAPSFMRVIRVAISQKGKHPQQNGINPPIQKLLQPRHDPAVHLIDALLNGIGQGQRHGSKYKGKNEVVTQARLR